MHDKVYREKKTDMDGLLSRIESGDFLVCGLGGSEPIEIVSHLHLLKDRGVRDCLLTNTLPMGNYPIFQDPDLADTVKVTSWFYTGALRSVHARGHIAFQPQHLHRALDKRLSTLGDRRKVLLTTCAPMDAHGYLSLSIGNTYEQQLIRSGEVTVLVEVNPNFPRTFGDNQVHISEIDALIETDRPVPALPIAEPSDRDRKIGRHIASLIEDGSTIQLGIGGIPNAVAEALKGKRDLGIHTEMFTDGMVDLLRDGTVTNKQKTLYPGRTVCTFALGTERLYAYLNDNPSVVFMPGTWTNDPNVIGMNRKMVSINTTIEVDLTGQCCSESLGHRQFSGTGGQADTAIGAQISEEGKSFIALYATAHVKQADGSRKLVSKIVPTLKEGAIVSLSRNDVDYVVTEYGVAHLRGKTVGERADALIAIAHPDFREELNRKKEALHYF